MSNLEFVLGVQLVGTVCVGAVAVAALLRVEREVKQLHTDAATREEYSFPNLHKPGYDYTKAVRAVRRATESVSSVTHPVAVTSPVTPDLSSELAQVPPWWEVPDSANGNQAVVAGSLLGTAVATTPTEADETSPEKSRGEKSGSHVD